MKLGVDLGKERRANIWFGELPSANFEGGRIVTVFLDRTNLAFQTKRQAALEVRINAGPRWVYGLLGGVLSPGQAGKLEVQIFISEDRTMEFKESIELGHEPVFVGLPDEYVRGLENGLRIGTRNLSRLPSGILRLSCAAHGEISSNQILFEHLTLSLIRLLAFEETDVSPEQVGRIFPESFNVPIKLTAMKLSSNETGLIGNWELVNGRVRGDATCERIECLTTRYLEKIAVDNWTILFRDPEDGRYWELTYPKGELQGAGPPALTAVDAEQVRAKYQFTESVRSNNH